VTLTADKNKIVADSKSKATILAADIKAIAADEVQLAKDDYALLKSEILNLI
jgi:hypothetical protein